MKRKIMVWFLILLLPLGLIAYYFYPEKKLPLGKTVDKLIVYKSKRQMHAYSGDELLKTYTISLGKKPIGHKQYEGDNKTPEGIYTINDRNPNSGYHKNLGVSYPNENDIAFAQKMGKPAGGEIKIHGLPNSKGYIGKFHRWKDWTAGCIAVTDGEVDELYKTVKQNAVIEIYP
ncbi:L,D-transpeptidase family protein [Flavobacterium salilacus subsp. salilacus]|uniref:L,D-transpeptidase family protein n=1 Tax=Flavobacterium TaxID=237 RepID=UPI001075170A|nr:MULTISPECIES: L,D-transpeptidase family protein [Flavobacterium]KAF2519721.1 L,D-transpeptidase family protein [Flavobacterium salilacus subsp. salilacus]MBE1614390.1 L,D-transpeptidase family protein [Flavobacterium sp. SaA2.13]